MKCNTAHLTLQLILLKRCTSYLNLGSFEHIESMSLNGLDGLEDFDYFFNKQVFGKLKEVRLDKITSAKQINRLKYHMPDTNIVILNY